MSFPTSFTTSKSCSDRRSASFAAHHSLTNLFIQPNHGRVITTPEYPQKQIVLVSPSPQDSGESRRSNSYMYADSIKITTEVLSMAKGGLSPRDAPRTLVPRPAKKGSRLPGLPPPIPLITERIKKRKKPRQDSTGAGNSGQRLNKFVRRLHDMLLVEKDSGVVEWRRGLLVLFSTDAFAKKLLPKYFNTRNFKTFRRQLNYYGFVHVRSFSTTGSSTTALWVNHDLANEGSDDISSVLKLKRVEPCEAGKTAEGRRHRKEQAIFTVEEDIGVSAKTLQLEQIRYMAIRGEEDVLDSSERKPVLSRRQPPIPTEVHFITDTSTIGSNCCGSSDRGSDGFEDTTTPPESDDFASTSAANVLLMLSRA